MSQFKWCLLREDMPDHHTQVSLCPPHKVLSHVFSSSSSFTLLLPQFVVHSPCRTCSRTAGALLLAPPPPRRLWRQDWIAELCGLP